MRDADQLAHARYRARIVAGQPTRNRERVEDTSDVRVGDEITQPCQLACGQLPTQRVDLTQQRVHLLAESRTTHRHTFVGECRTSQPPAAVDLTDHALVGHEHVVEKNLVEVGLTRQLAQWSDVDARRRHVDQEVGDPLVFRRLGIRARETDPPLRVVRLRGPDLLPCQTPTALDANSPGAQRRKVGACLGFAEQLAPDDVADEGRMHETCVLLGCSVREDRRDRPCPDHEVGTFDARAFELGVDEQLQRGVGAETMRRRPMRCEITGFGHRRPLRIRFGRRDRGDVGSDGATAMLDGGQVEFEASTPTEDAEATELFTLRGRGRRRRAQRQCRSQVEMCVVLKREADAAEHLDAVLSRRNGQRGDQHVGGEPGECELLARGFGVVVAHRCGHRSVDGHREIPRRRGDLFAATEHVGADVLDGLKRADGYTELGAHLGIVDRGVERPARHAAGVGDGGRRQCARNEITIVDDEQVSDAQVCNAQPANRASAVEARRWLDIA
ncbi:Uncharacterised protein [Mycobacteroides abscessus subsp. abscessus]|nr:Uncharacterised protein [Mycobacteroides abscessus subsp. abscessus]